MNDMHDVDARIDASLAAQVRAPRLDRQFDAAVWRRIEAAEKAAASPAALPVRGSDAPGWLRVGNVLGLVVAAVLAGYYGMQVGGDVVQNLSTAAAAEEGQRWVMPVSWTIAAIALAFGLRSTALGRWLRAEFF